MLYACKILLHPCVKGFLAMDERLFGDADRRAYFNCSIALRIHRDGMAGTPDRIAPTWYKLIPNQPLEYSFLDEDIRALYRGEGEWSRMVGYFSLLSIFIGRKDRAYSGDRYMIPGWSDTVSGRKK